MYNKLESIIKNTQGNVLVIGLDNKLLDKFTSNNKVNVYSINSKSENGVLSKKNKMKSNQGKVINIKKLRKYMNKKSIDYLIINMEEIFKYYKYVIKDTVFLSNNMIYIYSSNTIDKDFIIDKYRRYNLNINLTEYKTGYIITIDNKYGKNSVIKDTIFFIKDSFYNFAEAIGNLLIS